MKGIKGEPNSQAFWKGKSIWCGQGEGDQDQESETGLLSVLLEIFLGAQYRAGAGPLRKEPRKQTGESLGQLSAYVCGEVQSCLLGVKSSGKYKKLASEPCLVHSVPLCAPCSFCILLAHVQLLRAG